MWRFSLSAFSSLSFLQHFLKGLSPVVSEAHKSRLLTSELFSNSVFGEGPVSEAVKEFPAASAVAVNGEGVRNSILQRVLQLLQLLPPRLLLRLRLLHLLELLLLLGFFLGVRRKGVKVPLLLASRIFASRSHSLARRYAAACRTVGVCGRRREQIPG